MNKIAFLMLSGLLWSGAAWSGDMADMAGEAYVVRVDGLSCPFCAYGLEKKLKRLPGVTSFDMDMEKGLVILRVKPGTELNETQIRKEVSAAGFTARKITHGERHP